MATAAQTLANQENAKLSTGPVTPEGQARVGQNHLIHGLTGNFNLLDWEDVSQFNELKEGLLAEHKPETPGEFRLVASMIQHQWLMQRAILLQETILFEDARPSDAAQKRFGLFLRYQTVNERSYYKALKELQNLRKQKRAEEIGFESQKQQQAVVEAKVRLTNARAEALEIETEVRKTVEIPLPGNTRVEFSEIQDACAGAILAMRTNS